MRETTDVARHSDVEGIRIDMSGEAILRRLEKVSELNRLCRMLRESKPMRVEEMSEAYRTAPRPSSRQTNRDA